MRKFFFGGSDDHDDKARLLTPKHLHSPSDVEADNATLTPEEEMIADNLTKKIAYRVSSSWDLKLVFAFGIATYAGVCSGLVMSHYATKFYNSISMAEAYRDALEYPTMGISAFISFFLSLINGTSLWNELLHLTISFLDFTKGLAQNFLPVFLTLLSAIVTLKVTNDAGYGELIQWGRFFSATGTNGNSSQKMQANIIKLIGKKCCPPNVSNATTVVQDADKILKKHLRNKDDLSAYFDLMHKSGLLENLYSIQTSSNTTPDSLSSQDKINKIYGSLCNIIQIDNAKAYQESIDLFAPQRSSKYCCNPHCATPRILLSYTWGAFSTFSYLKAGLDTPALPIFNTVFDFEKHPELYLILGVMCGIASMWVNMALNSASIDDNLGNIPKPSSCVSTPFSCSTAFKISCYAVFAFFFALPNAGLAVMYPYNPFNQYISDKNMGMILGFLALTANFAVGTTTARNLKYRVENLYYGSFLGGDLLNNEKTAVSEGTERIRTPSQEYHLARLIEAGRIGAFKELLKFSEHKASNKILKPSEATLSNISIAPLTRAITEQNLVGLPDAIDTPMISHQSEDSRTQSSPSPRSR